MTSNELFADLSQGPACPIPISDYPTVLLAHGGGGKLTQHLIEKMFVPQFGDPTLAQMHDGAILTIGGARIAMSTDSYVVKPITFPGGSIGELAVNGTVNDIAMCGATPMFLSSAFIIEEGFPREELWKVVVAMQKAAASAGVRLVTGDTKVVDKGKGDGIFVNTAGIGLIPDGVNIRPDRAAPGDIVIVNGPIAAHGMAIMSVRQGLEFETEIRSDTAALNSLVADMLKACPDIHVLRDPTRGGVASATNEIAQSAKVGIELDERSIPIPDEVRGACEILGFDPLYVANEGKLLAFVPPTHADKVLAAMRANPAGRESAIIGNVVAEHPRTVVMKTSIGGNRVVDMLSGEQLPRIC
jgi:hydrogenase expression/formation protein HypE